MKRHAAKAMVSVEFLLIAANQQGANLPEDTRISEISIDRTRDVVTIYLESSKFPEVPEVGEPKVMDFPFKEIQ